MERHLGYYCLMEAFLDQLAPQVLVEQAGVVGDLQVKLEQLVLQV